MNTVYIIAEVGMAHDGSLGLAHSFIDALAGTGVNAVKFQVHIAEAESSLNEPFRVKFSYEDATRMDYWNRTAFSTGQWAGLKLHCEALGLDFIASPFSICAANLLKSIGTSKVKIASGEINNHLLIQHVAEFAETIFLSSGMSTWQELDDAIYLLRNRSVKLHIMQCTSAYPASPSLWGLNLLHEIKTRYGVAAGFSDHSGDIYASLAAAALGASVIEFHVTFDKLMFGPDASSSLNIQQVSQVVKGIRQLEAALSQPCNKHNLYVPEELKTMFGKSLAVNKDLKKGHRLSIQDLETKKPAGQGIDVRAYEDVLGQVLDRDLAGGDFLRNRDLA